MPAWLPVRSESLDGLVGRFISVQPAAAPSSSADGADDSGAGADSSSRAWVTGEVAAHDGFSHTGGVRLHDTASSLNKSAGRAQAGTCRWLCW
jgi:hypothetical protein